MVFYTPITGSFDLFPLFTWNIFRPYPDTPVNHHILLIHAVNGEKLDKPAEVVELKEQIFKNIKFYDFSHKVVRLGQLVRNKNGERVDELLMELEQSLLLTNQSVEYEIQRIKIHPIEYKKSQAVLEKEVLFHKTITKDRQDE